MKGSMDSCLTQSDSINTGSLMPVAPLSKIIVLDIVVRCQDYLKKTACLQEFRLIITTQGITEYLYGGITPPYPEKT
jgi:hypothetical protein